MVVPGWRGSAFLPHEQPSLLGSLLRRLHELPAWRVIEEVAAGNLDPADYAEAVARRAHELNDKLRAYITLRSVEEVVGEAESARGPLAPTLLAVKDVISVRGLPCTCASKMLSKYVPVFDATAVERCKARGAVILGKTNMDEFAMGSTGETSWYGATANPWDTSRVPGGSSSGSAAAVAAGMATFALGSDTGGSIRLPAAWTGIYGLKPTYGLVSRWGLIGYAESLEQIGPMARNPVDLAMLMEAVAGPDERDATSANVEVGGLVEAARRGDVSGWRIAILRDLVEHDGVDERVRGLVYEAAEKLGEAGARIVEVEVGEVVAKYALPAYYVIAMCEASSNLARYDNLLYGYKEPPRDWEDWVTYYSRVRGEGFGREVKRRIMLGAWMLSSGYREQYYVRALKVRRLVRDRMVALAKEYDLLLAPSAVAPPPKLGEMLGDPVRMYALDLANVPVNLAGLPALVAPVGRVDGVPMGIQLIGGYYSEAKLLEAAAALAKLTGMVDLVANP